MSGSISLIHQRVNIRTSANEWSFLDTLVESSANEWRHLFPCLEINPKSCGSISVLKYVLLARAEASHTLVEMNDYEWSFS
ncbi:hypothetical protein V6N12_069682 [Hibiscus sabdariffa]|uniref:Uncharacterized protein n=1 Tax=Hibiscus sabdariffa TaxID=183260 RepID=A0ABR2FEK0_9ROSI